nr:CCE_0567 family metalloprotein [Mesorhizobium kowhaii]
MQRRRQLHDLAKSLPIKLSEIKAVGGKTFDILAEWTLQGECSVHWRIHDDEPFRHPRRPEGSRNMRPLSTRRPASVAVAASRSADARSCNFTAWLRRVKPSASAPPRGTTSMSSSINPCGRGRINVFRQRSTDEATGPDLFARSGVHS